MIDMECSIYTDEIIPPGSDWYYSLLKCDANQKQAIGLLLSLTKEWEKALTTSHEAAIPQIKLHWWRDELVNTANGQPQHPYTKALAPFFDQYAISPMDLMACLDFFIHKTKSELPVSDEAWFQQAQGSVYEIVANKILQPDQNLPADYIRNLNQGLFVANNIIHLRHIITCGHIPFSQEALQKFSVDEHQLWELQHTSELEKLLHHYGALAEGFLRGLQNFLSKVQRTNQKSILCYAKLQLALLKELARDHYPVLHQHQHLTPIRKLIITWFQ